MALTIGQLADSTGVGIETLRFYEREGLMDAPARTRSGYRSYEDSAITRLNFIRRAQALGFSLKEIRELIDLHDRPQSDCSDINEVAQNKLRDVEKKISDLQQMRDTLKTLVASCQGGSTAECSVISCVTAVEAAGSSCRDADSLM